MATLVINAPRQMVEAESKKSFDEVLRTGIGEGYAIAKNLRAQCSPGCRVVLLSKDEQRRAEGRLKELVATEKTASGMQRYDVHIDGLMEVPYRSEALNRNGVAVI